MGLSNIPESGHLLSFAKPVLTGWIGKAVAWLFSGLVTYFFGFLTKYFVLILLSPMLALVSELTESKLTGKKYPFLFKQFLKDVWRGVLINLRNMLIEFFFIGLGVPLLLLNFIPVIGTILYFAYYAFLKILSWYFIGFALMDYNNERYKLSVGESAKFVRKNKGYAIGIGMTYSFFFWIPWIGNWTGIIFSPLLGTIGSTLSYLDIHKKEAEDAAKKNNQLSAKPN